MRDPHETVALYFATALHVDYPTAVEADVKEQVASTFPRFWYIDSTFRCARCSREFLFSVDEQKFWYEVIKIRVEKQPSECKDCKVKRKRMGELRHLYDQQITDALESNYIDKKLSVVKIIEELGSLDGGLPARIFENDTLLRKQISKMRQGEIG